MLGMLATCMPSGQQIDLHAVQQPGEHVIANVGGR